MLVNRGQHEEALAIALRALNADLEDRWFSKQTFLRQVRDDALQTGDHEDAFAWYVDRYPELHGETPNITVDNVQAAADLALLLQSAGESQSAVTLLDSALTWYQNAQPPGVHGILTNIVDVHLLALRGEKTAALSALREAIDGGWKYDWPLHMSNVNLDSIRDDPGFKSIVKQLEADMATQLKAIHAFPDMGEFDLRTVRPH
jgi:tetratricopeptide (TPR) repeat protein